MQDDVVPTPKKGKANNEVNDTSSQEGIRGKIRANKTILLVATVFAVLGFVGTVVFYQKYQDVKSNPGQAQKAQNSAETQRVLGELKKVLRIDEKEAPTVARVEDPAKLKTANAEFYKNVEKGDYLVIFPKRAVIYRESINQIINIAPIISTSGTAAEQKPAAADTKTTNTTTNPRTTTR
ncbi:hypothetical protein IPL68_01645 [Candidatus Saccharibacteria bacterium]|nr:MAG: hypothetical protein IPL68_01645 [Candidatus Saccharibacteria bacterium]